MWEISEVEITFVKPRNGLLGFASCLLNRQLFLSDIAIYNSPSSADYFRLVFPAKKLKNGKVIHLFHPVNSDLNQRIKQAVVAKIEDLIDRNGFDLGDES